MAASLAAQDPQLTLDGAALVAVTRLRIMALGGFEPSQARPQQAPFDGAALVVAIASVAALAALDLQQASGEAVLVGRPQLGPP